MKNDVKVMSEKDLHMLVCKYIKTKYPGVLFNSDMSGVKLTKGQAARASALRSSKGFPDIAIYEQRGNWIGLFVELKREGTKVYKKDGSLVSDKHIIEQSLMLESLSERGYYADFAIGYDEAIELIDKYLNYGR